MHGLLLLLLLFIMVVDQSLKLSKGSVIVCGSMSVAEVTTQLQI